MPTTGGGASANQGGGGCKMAGMPVRRGIPLTRLGVLAALALARRRRRSVALSARAVALFVALIALVVGCGSSEPTHDAPPDAGAFVRQPLVVRALGLPALRGVTDPVKRAARIRAAQTNPGPGYTVRMDGDTARLSALGLRLAGAPAVTSRSAVGNRVELRRGADLTEWYASGPLGLEQGFDVGKAPGGDEIVLDVAVTGAEAVQAGDGEIALVGAAQQVVVRYGEAHATDALGATLPVRLVARRDAIEIRVLVEGAAFPIEIDPMMWLTQAKLTASDGATGDWFGNAVALSGDTALVGDQRKNSNTGAAYIFVRSGFAWTQQQKLTASDAAAADWFGSSVSLSGDTALVGARYKDYETGAAYVFVRSGSTWTEQQKLAASDAATQDSFGWSVALSGDTALVGARQKSVYGWKFAGAAYVFLRSGSAWTQQQKLTASDAATDDFFGWSVALSGDTALVGAEGKNSGTGAVYVFLRSGSTWTEQQKLAASDAAASDAFGWSVALSGDTALVGAEGKNSSAGAAYVFLRSGSTWSEQQKLTASDAAASDYFGTSAALSGDTALVGANGKNSPAGAAYTFLRSGSTWAEQQKLAASDSTVSDYFGTSAALSGDTALVGANGGYTTIGGAYLFVFSDPFPSGTPCPLEGAVGCASGFCKDGYCCDSACDQPCRSCAATPGTCTPVTNTDDPDTCAGGNSCDASGACMCTDDAGCAAGWHCNAVGVCAAPKAQGAICDPTAGADCKQAGCRVCTSGHCVDGFCCDTACTDSCDVCASALGQGADGTCSLADTSYAGSPGCGAYACNGTSSLCPTSCASDAHCGTGYFCAADGTCKPRRGQGAVCDAQAGADCLVTGCRVCTTGNCEDGYCCNTTCSGACDVCNATPGTCTNAAKGAPGSPSCDPFLCGGSSASCAASCASDAECAADGWCDAASSTCKSDQALAATCTSSTQCTSGFCVDGVCCNSACTGLCQACAAAMKESGTGDGTCGNAKNGGDPHAQCAADAQSTCQQDGQCDGSGKCRLYQQGASCGSGTTCTGNFVKGQICDGLGACTTQATGVDCAPYVCRTGACTIPCAADADCTTSNFCDAGTCKPKIVNGQACTTAGTCQSGFCVDGVCCNTACNGICQACSAATKASGTGDGTCDNAAAGQDPHDSCPDDGAASCKRDGSCDGAGACADYATGTQCGAPSCSGNSATTHTCNGSGTCIDAPIDCGAYPCVSGVCAGKCTTSADCSSSGWCDAGTCKARHANGAACATGDECASTICADGVCCNAGCTGTCEACNETGTAGTCTPVAGAPRTGHGACSAGTPSEPCSAAQCDGIERTTCNAFVGSSVNCRAASCSGGVATLPAACDGKGNCPAADTKPCEPYTCGATACKTTCTTDTDCASGGHCQQGNCVSGTTCKDTTTSVDPAGNTTDCSPYLCASGVCPKQCTSSDDCISGYICDPSNKTCVPTTGDASANQGGCGCKMAGMPVRRGIPLTWLGVLAALALARRRRRSVALSARAAALFVALIAFVTPRARRGATARRRAPPISAPRGAAPRCRAARARGRLGDARRSSRASA